MTIRFLKPCPFCGGIANVCKGYKDSGGQDCEERMYAVRCSLGCFAKTNHFKTEDEAVDAWNTREPVQSVLKIY